MRTYLAALTLPMCWRLMFGQATTVTLSDPPPSRVTNPRSQNGADSVTRPFAVRSATA